LDISSAARGQVPTTLDELAAPPRRLQGKQFGLTVLPVGLEYLIVVLACGFRGPGVGMLRSGTCWWVRAGSLGVSTLVVGQVDHWWWVCFCPAIHLDRQSTLDPATITLIENA